MKVNAVTSNLYVKNKISLSSKSTNLKALKPKLKLTKKKRDVESYQPGTTDGSQPTLATMKAKGKNAFKTSNTSNEEALQRTSKPTKGIPDFITLQPKMVREAISSIFKILKQIDKKKEGNTKLLNISEPIFMQVESVKIPICSRKQLRFLMPHSLLSSESDILLITGDKKGQKIFPEKAVEHYTELLAKKNVDFIQKILPCKTLKLEYSQFESRRKLVDQYDVILADNSVIKFLYGWLGKLVNYKKKMPISVRLNTINLRDHLMTALRKTQMSVKGNGHMTSVQVGHTGMTEKELVANIEAVCSGLSALFPGGARNIRRLTIKTPSSIALPLYMSLVSPNEVKIPVEQKKKSMPVEGELSTILGATAVVYSDGNVVVKKDKDESLIDDLEDDEILIEVEKHIESAKTIRYDDSDEESDANNKHDQSIDEDMEADAVTDAMEQEIMNKYSKAASTGDQDLSGNSEEDDDIGLGSIGDQQNAPQKQKKGESSVKKAGPSNKGVLSTFGGKVKKGTDKKNKMNKGLRKALIKRKKAGKTK